MAADLNNLSISELKKIKKDNQLKLKKEYEELKKKQKLIEDIIKIQKTREKINKNQKPKSQPQFKPKNIKTFEDYFQKCIKNKTIPPDTPPYLRKALERAIREYEQGTEKEKSSLANFANKYVIKAKSGLMPDDFFLSKYSYLKEFLHNHRQIKVKFVLVTLMKEIDFGSTEGEVANFQEAYFHSDTYINIKSTKEEEILDKVMKKINDTIGKYQDKGSN